MKNKILILCPHPDDEIFALPLIKNFPIEYEISILYFTSTKRRRKEAEKSCILNKWNFIFASDLGFTFNDGFIHQKYKELNLLIRIVFEEFNIFISPIIEGGHQDHDSVGYCVLENSINKDIRNFYFYTTYTAFLDFGLYQVMSENKYAKSIFKTDKKSKIKIPLKAILLMFYLYKSQIITWLLLSIPFLLKFLSGNKVYFYKIKPNLFKSEINLIELLEGKPLYEIHKRCKKREWIKNVRFLNS